MSSEHQTHHAFTLLTEQLSRMTDELVSQRDSHLQLVKEVSSQNAMLATLAERITSHNRLIDERKNSDHARIGAIETRVSTTEMRLDDHDQARWRIAGASVVVAAFIASADEFVKWIT